MDRNITLLEAKVHIISALCAEEQFRLTHKSTNNRLSDFHVATSTKTLEKKREKTGSGRAERETVPKKALNDILAPYEASKS